MERDRSVSTLILDLTLGWRALAFTIVHPLLWKPVLVWIVFLLLVDVLLTVALFAKAFHFQVGVLADLLYSGISWLAWPLGFVLFLVETSVLTVLLYLVIFPQSKSHLVRATWKLKGATTLLHRAKTASRQPLRTELGTTLIFLLSQLLLSLATLPLHAVPGLGQVLYSYVNGYLLAWDLLRPWMEARQLSLRQQVRLVARNSHRLALFGLGVHAIMLVPVLNIVAVFSSPVAGALLALELDNELYA